MDNQAFEEINGPIVEDINELKLDSDRLLKLMKNFTCKDCTSSTATCFKCKKKGVYVPAESKKERSRKNAIIDENALESELTKCSTVNCYRFYHLSCVSGNRLIRYVDANQQKFRCPLHYCNKCSLTGDSMTLIQCFRCPTSFHSKCCPKEKSLKLSKKFMICQHHNPVKPENTLEDFGIKRKKPESRTPVNTSTLIKLPKFQDSLNEELSNDDSSQQNYKIKKKVDKFRSKEVEKNSKASKNIITSSKSSLELNPQPTTTQKPENMIKLKLPSKKSNRKDKLKPLIKKKPTPEPRFSYKDLGIASPQEFNYDTYKKDWCRYCGTRFSGSFTKGPWGPRTLCTVHYIDWMQKKSLNLSSFKEKPKKPINVKENRELSFISNKLKQNPDYNPKQELEEDVIRKKIKPNDDGGLEPGEVVKEEVSTQV